MGTVIYAVLLHAIPVFVSVPVAADRGPVPAPHLDVVVPLPADTVQLNGFEACNDYAEGWPDTDGDGWGAEFEPILFCDYYPSGYVLQSGDCDDTSPSINPGQPEICDDLDNDCSGTGDDGLPVDSAESNDSCATLHVLPEVGSDEMLTISTLTVYPEGDGDYYRIHATETDATCQQCDLLGLDEDYQLIVTLTVPEGAGSYQFCTSASCGSIDDSCIEVPAGESNAWTWTLDGSCVENDAYDRYFRVLGADPPGYECIPYTLSYEFRPGCFE